MEIYLFDSLQIEMQQAHNERCCEIEQKKKFVNKTVNWYNNYRCNYIKATNTQTNKKEKCY